MNSKDRDKELKELSQVIVEALTHNEEVMGLLADLKERNVIESTTLLGLALKINDLLEISGNAFQRNDAKQAEQELEAITGRGLENGADDERDLFDGRELTESEAAFVRWASERFNENEWLRNAGLIW